MTIVISFGIFYPFAKHVIQVNPMAPSIMMFLSMALSIDYSMFLLSRFAEERNKGKTVDDAVRNMLKYSAHVVCLSGFILIVCYMSIVIFPIAGMETIGYGAAIAIFICILINISLTASAILQFPNFYGKLETFPSCLPKCWVKVCPFCSCCCNVSKLESEIQSSATTTIDEKLLTINESQTKNDSTEDSSLHKVKQSSSMLGVPVNGKVSSDIGIGNDKEHISPVIPENIRLVSFYFYILRIELKLEIKIKPSN